MASRVLSDEEAEDEARGHLAEAKYELESFELSYTEGLRHARGEVEYAEEMLTDLMTARAELSKAHAKVTEADEEYGRVAAGHERIKKIIASYGTIHRVD